MIPLQNIPNCFSVKTIFRRKKSGSQNLPKKYYEDVKKQFALLYPNEKYTFKKIEDKLFLKFSKPLKLSNRYFKSEKISFEKSYFLSLKENGVYEVKLTSKTNHPNVIFLLFLKEGIDPENFSLKEFIEFIS